VTHNAGTSAATQLTLQSLSRDGGVPTFATVDFTATDNTGAEVALGQSGSAPRISFATAPPLANGLLRNTATSPNDATVGWATVNGSAFATHAVTTGIAPVGLISPPGNTSAGNPTANIEVLGNFAITSSSGYAINSLRLEPDADGESFEINTPGNLKTNAILLAGSRDYTISANGTGGLANASVGSVAAAARYIHVESATLTISARVDSAFLPLVKAGQGTLVLTNTNNVNMTTPTVINAGTLRATPTGSPGGSLPAGELELRGGVFEISGGGTFTRAVGRGSGSVNWSGIDSLDTPIDEDRGSGGFSAFGADATIDLNAVGASNIAWEDKGFVNSGHSLVFGSRTADHRVTWSDNLNLTATIGASNYNARDIRVIDNLASSTDSARIGGVISGTIQNDLLKTGTGVLELTGANTYAGATLVHEGTLLVNAPGTIGNSFLTQVRTGATLGGNGTVGPVKVAIGGRLAPGSNVADTGVLSSGSVTLDGPGAQFSIQLGGTVAGTTHDQLAVTGNIALNGGDLAGSLINGFAPAINDLFFIILNKGTNPVSGTFAQGNLVLIDFLPFEIGYEGNSQSNTFTGGSDVVLRFIPEPATTGLVVGGLALLLLRRRRA
jgi:autotransporter-associated beta strand protein